MVRVGETGVFTQVDIQSFSGDVHDGMRGQCRLSRASAAADSPFEASAARSDAKVWGGGGVVRMGVGSLTETQRSGRVVGFCGAEGVTGVTAHKGARRRRFGVW